MTEMPSRHLPAATSRGLRVTPSAVANDSAHSDPSDSGARWAWRYRCASRCRTPSSSPRSCSLPWPRACRGSPPRRTYAAGHRRRARRDRRDLAARARRGPHARPQGPGSRRERVQARRHRERVRVRNARHPLPPASDRRRAGVLRPRTSHRTRRTRARTAALAQVAAAPACLRPLPHPGDRGRTSRRCRVRRRADRGELGRGVPRGRRGGRRRARRRAHRGRASDSRRRPSRRRRDGGRVGERRRRHRGRAARRGRRVRPAARLGPGGHRRRAGALVTAHGCRGSADPLPSRRRPPPDPRRDADVRGRQAHPQALGRHRPLRDRDRRADAAHARHRRAPEARQPGPDPVPPAALQPQRRDVPDAEVPFDGGDRRGRPRGPARPERGIRRALQAAQRPTRHPRRPDAAQVLARRASAALERARRRHEHRRPAAAARQRGGLLRGERRTAACSSSRG